MQHDCTLHEQVRCAFSAMVSANVIGGAAMVAFNDNDFKAHQAISIPTEHEATITVISSCSAKGATAIAAICEATIMYLL